MQVRMNPCVPGWAGTTLFWILKFICGVYDLMLNLIYQKKVFKLLLNFSQRELFLGLALQLVFCFKDNFQKFKTLSNNSRKVFWQRFYVRGVTRHST